MASFARISRSLLESVGSSAETFHVYDVALHRSMSVIGCR